MSACAGRARYEEAQNRAWKRGDRFKMFWDAPDTPGVGMWWHGVVRGRVQRDRFDPLRDSPWEALRVRWDRCLPHLKRALCKALPLARSSSDPSPSQNPLIHPSAARGIKWHA